MSVEAARRMVEDPGIMARLGFPPEATELMRASLLDPDTPTVYGRFDLAYNGTGPAKLLEYNADTPTGLYEASVFQWIWLEQASQQGIIPQDVDQFNSLHEKLRDAYARLPKDSLLHFTCDADSVEDYGTIAYMM